MAGPMLQTIVRRNWSFQPCQVKSPIIICFDSFQFVSYCVSFVTRHLGAQFTKLKTLFLKSQLIFLLTQRKSVQVET